MAWSILRVIRCSSVCAHVHACGRAGASVSVKRLSCKAFVFMYLGRSDYEIRRQYYRTAFLSLISC